MGDIIILILVTSLLSYLVYFFYFYKLFNNELIVLKSNILFELNKKIMLIPDYLQILRSKRFNNKTLLGQIIKHRTQLMYAKDFSDKINANIELEHYLTKTYKKNYDSNEFEDFKNKLFTSQKVIDDFYSFYVLVLKRRDIFFNKFFNKFFLKIFGGFSNV